MAKAKAFQAAANPQPDDEVAVSIPRSLREELRAQRDRLDPSQDSLGRPRRQMGLDAFAELLVRKGLEWAASKPEWKDPLAL